MCKRCNCYTTSTKPSSRREHLIERFHIAEGTANETFSSRMNLMVSSITYRWSATEMSEREIRTRLESIGVGV